MLFKMSIITVKKLKDYITVKGKIVTVKRKMGGELSQIDILMNYKMK